MSDFRRILIIKPSSLGDIVHALPTLTALRRRFPHAHIAWLVKRGWAEILEGHEDLNEIIPLDLSLHKWPAMVAKLRRERFDVVVDLQGLFRSGLLAWVTGSSERIGFAGGREGSPLFYTQRVQLPVEKQSHWRLLNMHAVDRNLRIAAHLGADISTPQFSLPTFPDEEKRVNARLNDAGVRPEDRLIALAPRDRLGIRSWPLERFVAAGSCLGREQNVRIVLIGMPAERSMVEEFSQAVGDRLVDLVGRTTIRELVVLLRRVHLLIANDSAPMHIAAAVGTRVLGLFGPTNVTRARPYGDGHTVLQSGIPCSPCEARTCANRNRLECLTSIAVQQVVEAARAMVGHETEQRSAVLPHP